MSFTSLNLSEPLLKAIANKGYTQASPIQQKAIPAIMDGRDVMAAAQTGTGKTAGFTLPILERLSRGQPAQGNQVRALILTPTRELAAQVGDSVAAYGKYLRLKSAVVFGGVKINPQMMSLRRGVDILVATPGRLLDLYQQNAVKFKTLEILVLDEADRMLDMGFIRDIKKILALLPQQRQNLLFSATFSDDIRALAKGLLHSPLEISVSPANSTVDSITQRLYTVDKKRKADLLCFLIKEYSWKQVLVFCKTKHGANKLVRVLETAGIKAQAIHGNKSQSARTKALADFKKSSIRILVATDIAARGLDIDQLPQVVNFDLPNVPEDYVHRIGRTGRAGATGEAISLVSADEVKQLNDIERVIKKQIPRELIDGFEPVHDVPESRKTPKPKSQRSNSQRPKSEQPRSKQPGKSKKPTKARRPQSQPQKPGNKNKGANTALKPNSKVSNNSTNRKPRRQKRI